MLLLLNVLVVTVVALTCRVSVTTLITVTPVPLIILCATTWLVYFILLAGVNGRTAGQFVCGLSVRRHDAPLRLHAIMQRSLRVT